MRLLLIEDHHDVAQTTVMLLEIIGYDVQRATNGKEGIAMAQQFLPDIMIVDIGLPDMSGFDVAKLLRADERFSNTMMIALTGYDCEDQAKANGFTNYYKKPVDFDALDAFIKGKS